MLAGGTESTITPLCVGGFNAMKALSKRNDDPSGASRPFDKGRDGFVIGEGAGVLFLEELEHAKKRGARIYAELSGYALNSDAYHMTTPAPNGEGAARCMNLAIKDAGLVPEDIDYINTHGTSTYYGDLYETMAIKTVMGEHAKNVAVSSTKSMTGHLLGGAGGIEAVFSVMAIKGRGYPSDDQLRRSPTRSATLITCRIRQGKLISKPHYPIHSASAAPTGALSSVNSIPDARGN